MTLISQQNKTFSRYPSHFTKTQSHVSSDDEEESSAAHFHSALLPRLPPVLLNKISAAASCLVQGARIGTRWSVLSKYNLEAYGGVEMGWWGERCLPVWAATRNTHKHTRTHEGMIICKTKCKPIAIMHCSVHDRYRKQWTCISIWRHTHTDGDEYLTHTNRSWY